MFISHQLDLLPDLLTFSRYFAIDRPQLNDICLNHFHSWLICDPPISLLLDNHQKNYLLVHLILIVNLHEYVNAME